MYLVIGLGRGNNYWGINYTGGGGYELGRCEVWGIISLGQGCPPGC